MVAVPEVLEGEETVICADPEHLHERCPGAGQCHGCMSWCDRCGDVRTTCDAYRCDAHQCSRCRKALSANDIYLDENEQTHFKSCYACLHQMAAEEFEAEMLRWAERGRDTTDPQWALYCEAQIDSCAGELKKLMERG